MSAAPAGPLPVRVMVQDAWDHVALELPAETPLAELKARALAATRVTRDAAEYVVKYRGAELFDETRTLGEHRVVPNAHLIVLPRRRRPVR
ncbi:MAG: hypothetical protein NW201_04830 [Gemmatimonadales bacterium]|nr:hypothetical protein [Gemmatimonadales bacterium]